MPGGSILYEVAGDGFDDAGFAYLPDGPGRTLAAEVKEQLAFRHVSGPWYAWTASW